MRCKSEGNKSTPLGSLELVQGRSGLFNASNDDLILKLLRDPAYDVREDGTIWTKICITGKESKTNIWREAGGVDTKRGMVYRRLKYRGKNLQVHRIVFAKYGDTPLQKDLVVNHKDGNSLNNHPSNLELVTQSENNIHSFKSRPAVKGNSKINQEIAESIRGDYATGVYSIKTLRVKYKLSKSTISYILNDKIWITENAA